MRSYQLTRKPRYVLFFVLIFASIGSARSQSAGIVLLERDTLISLLQEFRAENGINPDKARTISLGNRDKNPEKRILARGFRVQIFAGPSRQDAYATQERFQKTYPGIDSYVTYTEPNYRVKVGDFRNRADATTFMNALRPQYGSASVFTEDIWVYE